MPYYPSRPEENEPEKNGAGPKRPPLSGKQRFLRAGLFCLSAALLLWGGIRLVSYGMDWVSSRQTRDEMLSVMREEPAETEAGQPEPEEKNAPAARAAVPAAVKAEDAAPAEAMPEDDRTAETPETAASPADASAGEELPVVEYPGGMKVNPKIQKLKKKSEYAVGWLAMDDLEEPVALKDNTFFLNHDAMGKRNANGAIFLDEYTGLLTRPYTLLLYGHNMKTGAMFGNLRKYREPAYALHHQTLHFDTLFEEGAYAIFAVGEISLVPETAGYVALEDLRSTRRPVRKAALKSLIGASEIGLALDVNEEDQFLLLITCTGDDDHRLVVAARRLRDGEGENSLTYPRGRS